MYRKSKLSIGLHLLGFYKEDGDWKYHLPIIPDVDIIREEPTQENNNIVSSKIRIEWLILELTITFRNHR